MISWKALILAQVGLFVVMVAISGMSSGLIWRSAKMSSGFMVFFLIDDDTWARKSE